MSKQKCEHICSSSFIYNKHWKQPKYSSAGEWINITVVYSYNVVMLNNEKEKNNWYDKDESQKHAGQNKQNTVRVHAEYACCTTPATWNSRPRTTNLQLWKASHLRPRMLVRGRQKGMREFFGVEMFYVSIVVEVTWVYIVFKTQTAYLKWEYFIACKHTSLSWFNKKTNKKNYNTDTSAHSSDWAKWKWLAKPSANWNSPHAVGMLTGTALGKQFSRIYRN